MDEMDVVVVAYQAGRFETVEACMDAIAHSDEYLWVSTTRQSPVVVVTHPMNRMDAATLVGGLNELGVYAQRYKASLFTGPQRPEDADKIGSKHEPRVPLGTYTLLNIFGDNLLLISESGACFLVISKRNYYHAFLPTDESIAWLGHP